MLARLVFASMERMVIDFGTVGYLEKTRQQRDRFKQVLDKIRASGLMSAIEGVRGRLDQLMPTGYCNSRIIQRLRVGNRVVSNGSHVDYVCPRIFVPRFWEIYAAKRLVRQAHEATATEL